MHFECHSLGFLGDIMKLKGEKCSASLGYVRKAWNSVLRLKWLRSAGL